MIVVVIVIVVVVSSIIFRYNSVRWNPSIIFRPYIFRPLYRTGHRCAQGTQSIRDHPGRTFLPLHSVLSFFSFFLPSFLSSFPPSLLHIPTYLPSFLHIPTCLPSFLLFTFLPPFLSYSFLPPFLSSFLSSCTPFPSFL